MDQFSLERFEHLAYSRQRESAALELTQLLHMLDSRYGSLGEGFAGRPLGAVPAQEVDLHVITRIAGAISALLSDPEFEFSEQGFDHFILWQRWLSLIFATSAFRNADHIIRALNINGGDLSHLTLQHRRALVKFCLLYTPESEINIDVETLWAHDKQLTATLCCVLMSPRFLGSPAAHQKREVLLQWLPPRLHEVGDLDALPLGILHDVYMHASYADLAGKHEIKRSINALIRKKLLQKGFADLPRPPPRDGKPLMLVVPEWLNAGHSVFRTHSASLVAARDYFHLLCVGNEQIMDDAARGLFHEFIPLLQAPLYQQLEQIRQLAQTRQPQVVYYPAVGMFPLTIFLSNLRLAPLQIAALGHAASTFSPQIDYFAVDEDFIGDPRCFSEQLLPLPVGAMPFVPTALMPRELVPRARSVTPEMVHIAVAATTMKINPRFLLACQAIAHNSKVPVHFHFLVGQAQGLVWPQVQQVIKNFLGNVATAHHHQPYPQYLHSLNECDLFLNPFPYGNMNGIVDTTALGLMGVCLQGPEVSSHIDVGMFRRAGFPDWLIARDEAGYVQAALRLIENHEERVGLGKALLRNDTVQRFYRGTPEIFAQKILALLTAPQPTALVTRAGVSL